MVLRSLICFVLIAVVIGIVACAPRQKPAPRGTTVVASLVGHPPTAVEVQVENLPPTQHIEQVFLVDRQGHKLTATDVEWNVQPGDRQVVTRPPLTFGVGFNSSLIIRLPGRTSERPQEPGQMTAQIPLSDGEAYLADPEAWTVVVEGWKRDGAPLSYTVPAPRLPVPDEDAPPLPGRKP